LASPFPIPSEDPDAEIISHTVVHPGDTIEGGQGNDTLYADIGNAAVAGVVADENVTSFISGIENIVLTSNAGTSISALDSSHSWNMSGFDGLSNAVHASMTIQGGDIGSGAIALSGFGKNVDFTFHDYERDPAAGGIDLSAVTGGWAGSDTLNIQLDGFVGALTADDLGSINFNSTGEIGHNNIVTLLSSDATSIGITGTVGLELEGMAAAADITVNNFTGDTLLLDLETDTGADSLDLTVNNVTTAIGSNTEYESASITSTGDNYLDLSFLDVDGTISVSGGGGNDLLTLIVNQDIDASTYTGLLNADASGASGSVSITGGSNDDFITGSSFDDSLIGGEGVDILTGGEGEDNFYFTAPVASGVDLITDFNADDDAIYLDSSIFANLGGAGVLDSGSFFTEENGLPTSSDGYVYYDSNTGALFYDDNGSDNIDAIQFAQLGLGGNTPDLSAANIVLV